jgi:uncharacterized protein
MIDRRRPALSKDTEAFWTGGQDGQLLIARCQACQLYLHPPVGVCRACRSQDIQPEPVSGRAVVYSYTINHQPWAETATEPYVVAVVELVEQEGLRLTTNIDCPLDDVRIGLEVDVDFLLFDGAWLPIFRPLSVGAGR